MPQRAIEELADIATGIEAETFAVVLLPRSKAVTGIKSDTPVIVSNDSTRFALL